MSATPLHDWLTPRLRALVQEAGRAGFPRASIVAVITDLITDPEFSPPPDPPPPDDASA